MQVNVTFVIQIINFLVTYWFLNTFLFKPFLSSLEQKHDLKESLDNQIANEGAILHALEEEKVTALVVFQKDFKNKYTPPEALRPKNLALITYSYKNIDRAQLTMKVKNYFLMKASDEY